MQESTRQMWFGRWRGWRGIVYTVVFVLVMVGIGFGFPRLVDAASGAPAVIQVQSTAPDTVPVEQSQRCCSAFAKEMARKFRAGEIRRDHGWKPGNWFTAPRKAKRVWVNKIARYLENHPNKWPRQRAAYRARSCYPASECYAADLYSDSVEDANCTSSAYLSLHSGARVCKHYYGQKFTKRQVQIYGTVVLCAGGVAIAARTGAGLFASIFGGVGCGWALWREVDPG